MGGARDHRTDAGGRVDRRQPATLGIEHRDGAGGPAIVIDGYRHGRSAGAGRPGVAGAGEVIGEDGNHGWGGGEGPRVAAYVKRRGRRRHRAKSGAGREPERRGVYSPTMSCPRTVAAVLLVLLACTPSAANDPFKSMNLIRPAKPRVAEDFSLKSPDGKTTIKLADYRGKVVFLNFWATWCKPCEEEMPSMERLHRKFKDQGLVVLALSEDADGAAAVMPFLKKHNLTFPVGLDPKMSVATLYGVWALPSTFIIDKRGNRAMFANGPREWDSPDAQALFQSLLQ